MMSVQIQNTLCTFHLKVWQFNLKNKVCDIVTNYGCGPQQNYLTTVVKYCTKWKQNTLKLFHYLKFYILLLYSATPIYSFYSKQWIWIPDWEKLNEGYLRLDYLCNHYVCICEQVNLFNKEIQIKWNGCYLGLLQLNAIREETLN